VVIAALHRTTGVNNPRAQLNVALRCGNIDPVAEQQEKV